jgi:hypothetical protein
MVHHIEYTRRAWLHMCVGELRNPHLVLLHTHLVLPQPLPLSVLLKKTDMWMYPEDGKCRPTDTSPRKGYCMPTTSHLPPLPSSRDLSKPLTYHDPTVKMRVYYCMSVQFVCPWRRNPYYSDEKKVWATQPSSSGSRPSFHRFLVNLNTHSSSGK